MTKALLLKLCTKCRPLAEVVAVGGLRLSGSFLRDWGWFESFYRRVPVDSAGNPLPWYTYSAIQFLEPRIRDNMSVFEYGGGYSTLWWSRRVSDVVTCEHDKEWADRLQPLLSANVTFEQRDLLEGGHYSKAVRDHPSSFDIVVIDSRERNECASAAIAGLKPGGVIIWDNSERECFAAGLAFLASEGFKKIDFWGSGPVNRYAWCTSVLYRASNCLGI